MSLEKMKSGLSDTISSLDTRLKEFLSFLTDIKEAGCDKVTAPVKDILSLAPLIELTGFNMKEISVDASMPPGITQTFLKEKEVDPETIDKLLEENKEKELLTLIVRASQRADALQNGIKLPDYKFRGLSRKMGLPPDISLKFSR
jgi:hypothetical protein